MYKISFNEYQKNIFSTVDFNGDKRNKLLSVFSYIKKYSPDGSLTKSINKLYSMYIRHHYKISNKYFYNLIDTLIELNLIEKIDNKIMLIQEKVQKKVQTFKVASDVENTSLEGDFEKPKDKVINNTIYPYNITNVVAPVELVTKAEELMKELGIRSTMVKKMVIGKLKTCKNIHRAGFISYILKVISEKKAIQVKRRMEYKANVIDNYNSFNDFPQRQYTATEYMAMEEGLLSWYRR